MFSKSFITSLFLLALTSSVNVHAAVVPPRRDVQLPSGPDGIPQNSTDGFNPAHDSRSMERVQVGESDTGNEAPRAVALPSAIHKATPAVSEVVKHPADKSSVNADQKVPAKKDGKKKAGKKGGKKKGDKKKDKKKGDKKEDVKKAGKLEDLVVTVVVENKEDKISKGRGGKGKKGGKSSGKGSKKASAAAKEKRFWSSRPSDGLA